MHTPSRKEKLDLTVRAAIADYAVSTDKPIADVIRWLATRKAVEIGADLIGLDAGGGLKVNRATVYALASVLREYGYANLTLFETGDDEDGDG